MKEILIYYPERKLRPTGGPAGYLYNLRQEFADVNHPDLSLSFLQSTEIEIEENKVLKDLMPERIKDFRRALKFSGYLRRERRVDENLLGYDIIHFHTTEDMYMNRKLLERYSGKVLLTSHTPCVPYKEVIGRLRPSDYQLFKHKIDKLVQMDEYAFERADHIIFPCEEAEEPYYNTWAKYPQIRKAEKYHYLPTGIAPCSVKINKRDIRSKYNIPSDAFVISYVGRHNEIKGYTDLKEIGKELLSEEKDIYFLIAGQERPITGLDSNRWIEVGWTNDPHSIIAASNVFVLPNRETYFDLVLLEVISLGIPVVLSSTGGNKYFKQFNCDGLKFYESLDEAKEMIYKYKNMEEKKRDLVGSELVKLFERHFTVSDFSKNYINILCDILGI